MVLPAGLLGYERDRSITSDVDMGQCILLDIPDLQLQLRLHDYSMGRSGHEPILWNQITH